MSTKFHRLDPLLLCDSCCLVGLQLMKEKENKQKGKRKQTDVFTKELESKQECLPPPALAHVLAEVLHVGVHVRFLGCFRNEDRYEEEMY